MSDEQYLRARDYVERLLAQHARTIWEIKTKSQQKKFPPEIIDRVIEEFSRAGFLNDEKYIESWLENQMKYRPSGRILCWKKLAAKGLASDLIKQKISEIYPEEMEKEAAKQLIRDKERLYKNLDKQKKAQKISLFLKSRGFGSDAIVAVLEERGLWG